MFCLAIGLGEGLGVGAGRQAPPIGSPRSGSATVKLSWENLRIIILLESDITTILSNLSSYIHCNVVKKKLFDRMFRFTQWNKRYSAM